MEGRERIGTVCGLMIISVGRGAFYYREKHDREDMWTR